MQKFADVVLDRKGNVVPGATVVVKTSANTNAVLYLDNGATVTANPVITDDFGRFSFYAANGRYSLQVFLGNILLTTATDILLEDPLDKTAEVIKGGTIEDVALTNVTINGQVPATKQDTDALDVRVTAQEAATTAVAGRATALEAADVMIDIRLDSLESLTGTIPAGLEERLGNIETAATTLSGRTGTSEVRIGGLETSVSALQATAVTEAPANDKKYARQNREWVALPPDTEYWDASVYLASVDLGPGNRVVELYPRLNLSRPILSNCFVRRATPAAENLTLLLKPTSGTDWTATCVIPAGQREGFFTSGDDMPLDSTQGIYITPSPLPSQSVDGVSITLRFEIEVVQTMSLLFVAQPAPIDTLVFFGERASTAPSFLMRHMDTGQLVNSNDFDGVIPSYLDASATRDGSALWYTRTDSQLYCCDMRAGALLKVKTAAGITARKGASVNQDGSRVLCAELRSGIWWAVAYNTATMTPAQEVNLASYGVMGTLNSIKYSPNDRYIQVGHSAGSLVLNALTMVPMTFLDAVPTGNVLDVDMTPSIYAVMSRKATDFSLHITINGQSMTRYMTTVWTEITCSAFNWFTDVPSPYPYFVVAGNTSAGWQVVPFSATDFNYAELGWKINFGERIVSVAFSETTQIDDQTTEATYGRALVVFGEHGYKVYDLLSGTELAAQTVATYTKITGGVWKWAKGLPV